MTAMETLGLSKPAIALIRLSRADVERCG